MRHTATIDKQIGETPLQALERYRSITSLSPEVPLAYAGRLDPMATGKLLILIGEECKRQQTYHGLDKRYEIEVLLGVGSDTGDVLGRLEAGPAITLSDATLPAVLPDFIGKLSLPYPQFSAKTVQGKPLHQWTLEGRLDEIEIPVAHTTIYNLRLRSICSVPAITVYRTTRAKIDSFPPVTDERKALGADFRREEVRADWEAWRDANLHAEYCIVSLSVTCSSGTYMRSLAQTLGERLGTTGLAFSIHRTHIGHFRQLPAWFGGGFFFPQW